MNKRFFVLISLALNIVLAALVIGLIMQKPNNVFNDKAYASSIVTLSPTEDDYRYDRVSQFLLLKGDSQDIIFIGDSLTNMGEWSELFKNNHVKNRGINGDNILGVLKRIKGTIAWKPSKIFIMIGVNSLSTTANLDVLISQYSSIITIIKNNSPTTKIYIQSVLPIDDTYWDTNVNAGLRSKTVTNTIIRNFNSKLKILTIKNSCTYLDLFGSFCDTSGKLDDKYSIAGLHLTGEGYIHWRNLIKNFVNE